MTTSTAGLATLLAALSLFAIACPAAAQSLRLGMPMTTVELVYPAAHRVEAHTGATILEVSDVDYAHTHWQTLDLVFDASGQLEAAHFAVQGASFDQVRAQLVRQWDAEAAIGGQGAPVLGAKSAPQIKICDRGEAGVLLTYERPPSRE